MENCQTKQQSIHLVRQTVFLCALLRLLDKKECGFFQQFLRNELTIDFTVQTLAAVSNSVRFILNQTRF